MLALNKLNSQGISAVFNMILTYTISYPMWSFIKQVKRPHQSPVLTYHKFISRHSLIVIITPAAHLDAIYCYTLHALALPNKSWTNPFKCLCIDYLLLSLLILKIVSLLFRLMMIMMMILWWWWLVYNTKTTQQA